MPGTVLRDVIIFLIQSYPLTHLSERSLVIRERMVSLASHREPMVQSLIGLNYIKIMLSTIPAEKMFHLSQEDTKDTKLLYYSDIVKKMHLVVRGKN